MKTLIKHATVVLPDETLVTNVLLDRGKIATVDAAEHAAADEVVSARGLHLIPGVIDTHVHFREPGLTHKEDLHAGSLACAKGGVTTFLEMPNTKPPTTTVARICEKLDLAARKCVVNYGFYIAATPHNIEELKAAEQTPGIKIFIGSSTGDLLVDDQESLERIFAETTLPICAHCEDETTVRANARRLGGGKTVADHSRIRDEAAAVIATRRAIDLAQRHNHRFHVLHVSTAAELPLIAAAAPLVTAEVCPHHLFFNADDYDRLGTRVQMNPSVKTAADNAALWQGLEDGMLAMVVTDHAPHTVQEKNVNYPTSPSGLPAVENSLALMLNEVSQGRIALQQVIRWMCDGPARVWGIQRKGKILAGFDADVVLVDLNKSERIADNSQVTKCKWSPWQGVTLTGWPVRTWVAGQCVMVNGNLDDRIRGSAASFARAP